MESPKPYTATLHVLGSPEHALNAIANIAAWWGTDVDGQATEAGNAFTIHFGTTFVTFRVTELLEGRKAVWEVTRSRLPWLKFDPEEWTGTRIEWQTMPHENGTNITMIHHGLTPEVECFEACESGWNQHILHSLANYINTGSGSPTPGKREAA